MNLSKPSRQNLPTVNCKCGAAILVIPNVELMDKAIETHVKEHKEKVKGHREAEKEAECIRLDLIAKVFEKAYQAQKL